MRLERRKPPVPTLELTPLVDVVFLLLTFYMLTSSFVREDLIPLDLPSSKSSESDVKEIVAISLLDDSSVYLKSELLPISELSKRLPEVATPDAAIVVRAEKNGSVQALVSVLDQIKEAGFDDLSLATEGS